MFWTSPIDLMDINSLSAVPCMLGMVSIPSAWFAVPWQTFRWWELQIVLLWITIHLVLFCFYWHFSMHFLWVFFVCWGYQKPPNRSCAKGALCDFCHLHGGKRGKKSRQARNMTTWPVSESQVQWEIQWISIHQEYIIPSMGLWYLPTFTIKVNHSCR